MSKIKIAYCPTMEKYANVIGSKVADIDLINANSAAQVLAMLKENLVDIVLIGRTAKSWEINNHIDFLRLKNGYTLIYKQKMGIYYADLKQVEINTYINREKIKDIAHLFKKINFFTNFDDCLKNGLDIPILIDWKDFRDEFELLIPMDENGKVAYFRAPVLYYNRNVNNQLIKNLKNAIDNDEYISK